MKMNHKDQDETKTNLVQDLEKLEVRSIEGRGWVIFDEGRDTVYEYDTENDALLACDAMLEGYDKRQSSGDDRLIERTKKIVSEMTDTELREELIRCHVREMSLVEVIHDLHAKLDELIAEKKG